MWPRPPEASPFAAPAVAAWTCHPVPSRRVLVAATATPCDGIAGTPGVGDSAAACGLLEALACELRRVDSPRLAVDALAHVRFDLVLVDGRDPSSFGADIVHAIRLHESLAEATPVAIAVLVARPPLRASRVYLALGADEVLAAPVTRAVLAALLARWCEPPPA